MTPWPASPPDPAKRVLRRRMRALLAELGDAERTAQAAANARALLARLDPGHALAAYAAMSHECDPAAVVEAWWSAGRPVWLPRMLPDRRLTWHPVTAPDQLAPGAAGIREPRPDRVPAAELPPGTWVVTPGLAFTADGHRLGQGGGCYDRVLGRADLVAVGYAFPVQLVPVLPQEEHDLPVRAVLAGGTWYDAGLPTG